MRNAAKAGGAVKKKKYYDGGMTGDPKKTTGKKGAVYPSAPSPTKMTGPKKPAQIAPTNRVAPQMAKPAPMVAKPSVQPTPPVVEKTSSVRNPMKKATRIDNKIQRLTNRQDRIGEDGGMNRREFERAGRIRRKKYELTNKRNALTNYTEVNMAKGGKVKKKYNAGGGVKHPGFKAVQAKIAAKSGVSKKAAGAILAASTRKASAKAKAANPRLKRVKG